LTPSSIDDLVADVPAGTVLYDLFACESPAAAAKPEFLERIGRVVTLSPFQASGPNEEIFFKHQAKEEDFKLRPEWLAQLSTPCQVKGGASGPVGMHAGHALFERAIGAGTYRDYEKGSAISARGRPPPPETRSP